MAESIRRLAFGLAEAFLRGRWDVDELSQNAKSVLVPAPQGKWVKSLARRVVIAFRDRSRPLSGQLIRFLEQDELFLQYCGDPADDDKSGFDVDISQLPKPSMQPAAGAASGWAVRSLVTAGEVADWLHITTRELDWFAGTYGKRSLRSECRLEHFRYRWIIKTSGGHRLLEIPKSRLKDIQRQILDEILSKIPPHPAAHAYRHGRSIASSVTPHVGKRIVIHVDLREFFPSVRASQVHAIFRTAGYPERVASILTGICTNMTPRNVFVSAEVPCADDYRWKRYGSPHLPQGAPTSPALANLAAFWLDCRLSGLARKIGADYTRYADDLVFSGGAELDRCASRFRVLVAAIVHHEGFEIRLHKTREMRSGSRQQIAGITLNQHLNIPRHEYDLLRAIFHNCRVHGPASQNQGNREHFREHLLGRLAYWSTICPERTRKLRAMFDLIVWG